MINLYEKLLDEAVDDSIIVKEVSLKSKSDGLYKDNKIALNKNTLSTIAEKSCILAEELGHHYKTYGNIIDLSNIDNIKQEKKARQFAYNKLVDVSGLVNAFKHGAKNIDETAEYLSVTTKFLCEAIDYYKEKYGTTPVTVDDCTIVFVPYLIIYRKL